MPVFDPTIASSLCRSTAKEANAAVLALFDHVEESGLLEAHGSGGEKRYPAGDAEVAAVCAQLAEYGIGARNLRAFRTAAARQASLFGQRQSASHSARTSRVLQAGQHRGNRQGFESFGRFESTGPTTSGITSPARRTMAVSPTRTSRRFTSASLWSVA